MFYKNYEKLLEEKKYTKVDISKAALILHPDKIDKYGLKQAEIAMLFEEGSNFTQLKNPIIDEFDNEYWDSEGYYMAQRIDNIEIKKFIAFCSMASGLSKKAAYLHEGLLDTDLSSRIEYMRKSIKSKFDNNLELKDLLIQTGNREIIEYTYWGDTTFGVDSVVNKGKNLLGKLLMEYRDNCI